MDNPKFAESAPQGNADSSRSFHDELHQIQAKLPAFDDSKANGHSSAEKIGAGLPDSAAVGIFKLSNDQHNKTGVGEIESKEPSQENKDSVKSIFDQRVDLLISSEKPSAETVMKLNELKKLDHAIVDGDLNEIKAVNAKVFDPAFMNVTAEGLLQKGLPGLSIQYMAADGFDGIEIGAEHAGTITLDSPLGRIPTSIDVESNDSSSKESVLKAMSKIVVEAAWTGPNG